MKAKTQKRFKVIMPIAVSAKDKDEAIKKVRAMFEYGYYEGKALRFAPDKSAPDPVVEELPF